MMEFVSVHWLDIVTTLLGLLYLFFEYKASLWLWAVAFVMQIMNMFLYYNHGLYADCSMEVYYTAMTIYGFVNWKFLHKQTEEKMVTHFERKFIVPWVIISLLAWFVIWWLLVTFTDSKVPVADSFTTAMSFCALWALARKYLEQWLLWIVVDAVTVILYFYKGIPFKAGLHIVYIIVAVAGYFKWKKKIYRKKLLVQKKLNNFAEIG